MCPWQIFSAVVALWLEIYIVRSCYYAASERCIKAFGVCCLTIQFLDALQT